MINVKQQKPGKNLETYSIYFNKNAADFLNDTVPWFESVVVQFKLETAPVLWFTKKNRLRISSRSRDIFDSLKQSGS